VVQYLAGDLTVRSTQVHAYIRSWAMGTIHTRACRCHRSHVQVSRLPMESMRVNAHTVAFMCEHACIYVRTRMHLCAYTHAFMCEHACIYVRTRMHLCVYTREQSHYGSKQRKEACTLIAGALEAGCGIKVSDGGDGSRACYAHVRTRTLRC
jgi:hypothetical protein